MSRTSRHLVAIRNGTSKIADGEEYSDLFNETLQ